MAIDIYQAVTDRIIALLDQGTVPWKHPIKSSGGTGLMPTNLHSQRAYRGINVFLLAVTAWAEGYDSPYWLTFKQAREKSGHVRKGEKGTLVIFWKQYNTNDKKTGEPVKIPVLRHYTVFNSEQCEGVEIKTGNREEDNNGVGVGVFEPIEACAGDRGRATSYRPTRSASLSRRSSTPKKGTTQRSFMSWSTMPRAGLCRTGGAEC